MQLGVVFARYNSLESKQGEAIDTNSCNFASPEMANRFVEQGIARLQDRGLRVTATRVLVLRTMGEVNAALTPAAIRQRIVLAGARVDLVTVYRVLQTLLDEGLVHHIGVTDGYYACREHHQVGGHAEHLVCRSCGCVTELSLPPESSNQFKERASLAGFLPEDIHVESIGLCQHCRSAK